MQYRNSYALGFTVLCLFFIVAASMAGRGGGFPGSSNVVVTNSAGQPIPATVQGTAKVAIQGEPTVIAAQPTTGYRINNGTTNPVPVSIGSGSEVTIANSGMNPVIAALEGSVAATINNTAASPVNTKIVGSPSVTISGSPSVSISNPASSFDSAQDLITLFDTQASDNSMYNVPSGDNFVIDTVSASCSASQTCPYVTVTAEPAGLGQVLSQLMIPMDYVSQGGGDYNSMITLQCHMVVPSGGWLIYAMANGFGVTVNSAEITITGYLVPANGPAAHGKSH